MDDDGEVDADKTGDVYHEHGDDEDAWNEAYDGVKNLPKHFG